MEQMNNEHIIYNAALYCRLSKDDEQAGVQESSDASFDKSHLIGLSR